MKPFPDEVELRLTDSSRPVAEAVVSLAHAQLLASSLEPLEIALVALRVWLRRTFGHSDGADIFRLILVNELGPRDATMLRLRLDTCELRQSTP